MVTMLEWARRSPCHANRWQLWQELAEAGAMVRVGCCWTPSPGALQAALEALGDPQERAELLARFDSPDPPNPLDWGPVSLRDEEARRIQRLALTPRRFRRAPATARERCWLRWVDTGVLDGLLWPWDPSHVVHHVAWALIAPAKEVCCD